MPTSPRETQLCRYSYDSMDRTIAWTPGKQASLQRFFCKDRLATEIQAAAKYCFLQHDDHVLAQQLQIGTTADTTLLATDQQRSVLNAIDATQPNPLAYSPHGHRPQGNGLLSLLGFNGERPDPVTGHYHLGNGYRQFNPVLMRFNSPDSWSPFGRGGLNAYGYCDGDSVNRTDPTGHVVIPLVRDFERSARRLHLETLQLLFVTDFKLGGTDAIMKSAKETATSPQKIVIRSAAEAQAETIVPKINSFEGSLARLSNRAQMDSARETAIRSLQENVFLDLATLNKNDPSSIVEYHIEASMKKIREFKISSKETIEKAVFKRQMADYLRSTGANFRPDSPPPSYTSWSSLAEYRQT